MNYFVFLPASEAKNFEDRRRSVYKSDYLDIRLKKTMGDEENDNNDIEEQQQQQEENENVEDELGMCRLFPL